ncbi:MAG: beta-ketoacyl-[acyl-carrier-protein] synthase II [Chloroflexi bacterium]|jgi:beta-ketoacyl-acyl-carrier-protein synthase II|nr:beta-ketoacyl-[acyl-carrier-protein] synthase II [Chloroflexota bacterium]MDL1882785.1 beta-ketoacyl-ACP synthase II [Anaerolineae bacterium CFX8]
MELLRNGRPRVVITGLGAVTALGPVKALWESLKAGRSGIRRIETIPIEHVPVKIAGEVRDFDASEYIDRKEIRRMGRASQFAVVASRAALDDAGLTIEDIEAEGERVGVVIGSSLGAHEMAEQSTFKYKTSGYLKPNPLGLINSLPNMPAHYVSRFLRALGPLNAPSTACAAGTQSIGEASELIKNGRADMVLTGGVESVLQDYAIAGFDAMNALANEYNDNPEAASRPFDANRSGFVFSEGCGVVVVESLAHALKRGARIYAEVLGHASASDAFHIAALDPDGGGAMRSMRWALEDAHLNPEDIQYINAHGTSTKANDVMETLAIKRVFGEHAYNLAVSSTKSMLGHALAGSGAIEVIACALSLIEQVLHPTINYETPDPECDLDYVPNVAREVKGLKYILSNSFGLGGQNASIVLGAI